MTSLPATMNGYRVWMDYLLAQNPRDARWDRRTLGPHSLRYQTSALYETANWNSYLARVHGEHRDSALGVSQASRYSRFLMVQPLLNCVPC